MTESAAPPQANELLKQAVSLLNAGDLAGADRVLSTVLTDNPRDADALQLKGSLYRRSGRLDEAIAHLTASLEVREAQPHVHNNLGSALAAKDLNAEAETHYRRALALHPRYADASYNLGLVLMKSQDWPQAKLAFEMALRDDFGHARAADALSVVLGKLGDLEGAVASAKRSVALSNASHTAQHNLGQALLAVGDHAEAQAAYTAAIRLKPNSDASWIGLGHVHRHLGKTADALAAYRQAVKINPSNTDAHRLFNEMVWQSGDTDNYLSSYAEALIQRPADAHLRLNYANELMRYRQYAGARSELLRAAVAAPYDGRIADAAARLSSLTGDYDLAISDHRRAIQALPDDPLIHRNFLETLLKAGRHTEAVDLSNSARERFPQEQGVLALHTTALRLAGERERHDAIANYATLPGVFDLEPPKGFKDVVAFNKELAACLANLHTTKAHPTDQTLRGGTQTFGALFTRPEPIIAALRSQIEGAVAEYIRRMPNDRAHPFFARKAAAFRFSGSWSVRLQWDGFHVNHFHPLGWISSAYYVELPRATGDATLQQGWLKMGETNLDLGANESVERVVQPAVGRLVLFPSYFWHGTVPFQGEGTRMSVAFDVVPA